MIIEILLHPSAAYSSIANIKATISRQKIRSCVLVALLNVLITIQLFSQTHLTAVVDWTESTDYSLQLEDLIAPIKTVVQGENGELNVIFITDNRPVVFTLTIQPFGQFTTMTPLDVIRKRQAQANYDKGIQGKVRKFINEVQDFLESTPKFQGTNINGAIRALKMKLNEPHLESARQVVILLTDGCQSRMGSSECHCPVELVRSEQVQFIYVGWKNMSCRISAKVTDYTTFQGASSYAHNLFHNKN